MTRVLIAFHTAEVPLSCTSNPVVADDALHVRISENEDQEVNAVLRQVAIYASVWRRTS